MKGFSKVLDSKAIQALKNNSPDAIVSNKVISQSAAILTEAGLLVGA
jgi:hypothetical protein